MKIKCNPNRFRVIGGAVSSLIEGWEDSSISIDTEYTVFGIGLYLNCVKLLIDPREDCKPFWYSGDHFDVIDNRTPKKWEIFLDKGDWSLIIGYHELVCSIRHFDGILERDQKELEVFFRAKAELESE